MSPSDRELASRFIGRGEEEAFRLLFRRHTPRVYAVALRLMRGRASDAEDVVQEVWQRAAQRLGAFEWRSSFSTWLVGIAINCAREHLRVNPATETIPEALAAVPGPLAPAPVAIDLERAIAALPDRLRLVLVLHDVEGWTHAEIGAHLDIAAGTSKSDLFQARRAVRARLTA